MAMKDAASQRYASARRHAASEPEISEWGNPLHKKYRTAVKAVRSVHGEVKHLSTRRKGKQDTFSITIPLVAESETGIAQTASISDRCGVVGQWNSCRQRQGKVTKCIVSGTRWNARPQRVKVPYTKTLHLSSVVPE